MTQNKHEPSSSKASLTVGRDSSHSSEVANRREFLQNKTLQSLQITSAPGIFKGTPEQAFAEGTAIHTAIRYEPERTRTTLCELIEQTVRFIDAKKTLDVQGVMFTAEAIIQNNPSTTLEEMRMVCDGMKTGKFGKFYERLKTQEFIDCLNRSEGDRAEFLERRARAHENVSKDIDVTNITYQPTTMKELRRRKAAPIFELAKHIAELQTKKDDEQN